MSGSIGLRTNHSIVGLESRIYQGQILYLKGEEVISERAIEELEIERGALGHPVLILQLDMNRKHARICILTTFGGRGIQNSVSPWRWNEYLPLYPTVALQDQIQVELCYRMKLERPSYINTAKSYIVPVSMLEILNHEGLTGIPQLTLPGFAVVAERFKINVEALPKQVRVWYETWQAVQQSARQIALEKVQARDSLANEANETRSKDAAPSKPARRVGSRTVVLLVALSAALALLFRHAVLGEQSVSCDY